MHDILSRVSVFWRGDFSQHLSYYLFQFFLVGLIALLFSGVVVLVRFVSDPFCVNVLRLRHDGRGPGLVGLLISVVILIYSITYVSGRFPETRPTVIGWANDKIQSAMAWKNQPGPPKPGSAGLRPRAAGPSSSSVVQPTPNPPRTAPSPSP